MKILNIFCDASIKKVDGITYGCAGAIAFDNLDKTNFNLAPIKEKVIQKYANCTNNYSEINAIRLSVLIANKYKNDYERINIFSDSKLCIKGLTEWMFNWVKCQTDNIMISSSGTEVANQSIFCEIVQFILNNNLKINFYHQKGHVTSTDKNIENAIRVFYESNGIKLDRTTMVILSYFNNMIDVITGEELEISLNDISTRPMNFYPVNNLCTYRKLIMKDGGLKI